jgi:decaprenyl-phosphate phosphoribosyltransferase
MIDLIRLIRPTHWVKNAFVAAPLFFTPSVMSWASAEAVALAVAAFSLAASAIYALNDWADRHADRLHPKKRHRPVASGNVPPHAALLVAALLAIAAAAIATRLPPGFGGVLAIYFAMNLAYSFGLKNVSLLDVLVVAMGFVLRIEAGAAAIQVAPTEWILLCTGLLALFLALAKRRDDVTSELSREHRKALVGYNLAFIDTAIAIVLAALLVGYLIYTTDDGVMRKYGTERLYTTVPFVIAGILRYLQIALVEKRSGSPTEIALTDRFIVVCVLGWLAVFGYLIYL